MGFSSSKLLNTYCAGFRDESVSGIYAAGSIGGAHRLPVDPSGKLVKVAEPNGNVASPRR